MRRAQQPCIIPYGCNLCNTYRSAARLRTTRVGYISSVVACEGGAGLLRQMRAAIRSQL
jgi:hypothetical protein